MTEEEAKTKWCPFVRHEGDNGGTFNRGARGNLLNVHEANQGMTCNCIGSACMAWRWTGLEYEYVTMDNREHDKAHPGWLTHKDGPPPVPEGEGWEPVEEPRQASGFVRGILKQCWRRPYKSRDGMCGLAGKP